MARKSKKIEFIKNRVEKLFIKTSIIITENNIVLDDVLATYMMAIQQVILH